MAKVNIVRPGEGEVLSGGPSQVRILENGEHTNHRLGFAEITIAPGFPSPLQHRHAQHDEGFYVLSGTIRFTVGQDDYDAGPALGSSFRPAPRTRSPTPAKARRSCSTPSRQTCTCSTSATSRP